MFAGVKRAHDKRRESRETTSEKSKDAGFGGEGGGPFALTE